VRLIKDGFYVVAWVLFMLFAHVVNSQVAPSFFGMHINNSTDPTPAAIPFAGYRSLTGQWDWADIETAPGVYNWKRADIWLAKAEAAHADVLYTFFRTPVFHSSNPNGACTGTPKGQCYPPSDVGTTDAAFKAFVTAFVAHVGPKVTYYENWNEYNISWNGTVAQLVRMQQDARAIILPKNPAAKFISPSVAFAFNAKKEPFLRPVTDYFSTPEAFAVTDLVGIHGYVQQASPLNPQPEVLFNLINGVKGVFTGISPKRPIIDTEWSWGVTSTFTNPAARSAFLARGLILQLSLGIDRAYWFGLDEGNSGVFWWPNITDNNCKGGTPAQSRGYICPAGKTYSVLYSWLIGSMVGGCNGPAPPAVGPWSCPIVLANGRSGMLAWTSGAATQWSYPTAYHSYSTLAGTVAPLPPLSVPLTALPVLLY
jgi:hypothetical protein